MWYRYWLTVHITLTEMAKRLEESLNGFRPGVWVAAVAANMMAAGSLVACYFHHRHRKSGQSLLPSHNECSTFLPFVIFLKLITLLWDSFIDSSSYIAFTYPSHSNLLLVLIGYPCTGETEDPEKIELVPNIIENPGYRFPDLDPAHQAFLNSTAIAAAAVWVLPHLR